MKKTLKRVLIGVSVVVGLVGGYTAAYFGIYGNLITEKQQIEILNKFVERKEDKLFHLIRVYSDDSLIGDWFCDLKRGENPRLMMNYTNDQEGEAVIGLNENGTTELHEGEGNKKTVTNESVDDFYNSMIIFPISSLDFDYSISTQNIWLAKGKNRIQSYAKYKNDSFTFSFPKANVQHTLTDFSYSLSYKADTDFNQKYGLDFVFSGLENGHVINVCWMVGYRF